MGEHYNELSAILRRVRARWRAVTALRAWTWGAAAAACVLLVALAVHRLAAPEGTSLVALWGAATIVALACIIWLVAPLRRVLPDQQVARLVEEHCPELEDALITAIAERDQTGRRAMLASVLADAVRRCRDLDLDRIVSREALRKAVMSASAATVALFVLGVFSAGPAGDAARVFALYLFPERVALEVLPGDIRLRAGQPLRVRARIPGTSGAVVPMLRYGGQQEWREARMQPDQDGFAFAFENVEQSFSYSVAAATVRSREYTVTVIRPPRVERIDLHYEYPRSFGMKPRVEEDSGDIYGPVGTKVRITVHTDKPITSAALTLSDSKPVMLRQADEGAVGELQIAEDGSYRVALADGDGLSNPGDTEYFIRTLEDRPPDVRVIRPAGDRQVTPIEEVSIEARADDDFGIAAFDLVYSIRGGEEKSVPFRREGSGMTVNGSRTVYLEELDVEPGDFVTYYARARDVSRGKRSTEARSDIFFLEVKPFEEEFVAAQSQAMGGGSGDRSLDDLAEAQKEIIVATWKLDARGRNARGQSQEDIRNVARAQAELQKRAQAAAGQLNRPNLQQRRRRSAAPAGPTEPSTTDEPMAKAVVAMGKAVTELDALKTAGALPHEMAALNELLRAQAEVRKRQVQRQQNAMGGRGSNRQQQDLSSLFDRELARQQQTNYETPNSSETREEEQDESSALDKIRELARRQDALNREQQELAKRRAEMTEEELRRQLEKLTREQSELRRQAEELARQMQQQRGGQESSQQQSQQNSRNQQGQQQQGKNQSGQGQQSSQNAEASRTLREASEEMQGATSDLRRQDPSQASSRGNRALEKLRDLEQRMRIARPDDRRRALGELQLESRQLADAQRQLANEGQRQGGQSADGARRRSAEQNRLADRMQRLEESVRQLAQGAQGAEADERKALADAAREVDRQRLAERMRQAAKQAEAGAAQGTDGDNRTAAREGEDIAKQLERLAERLGLANGQSAESRRLSEQLARNRELREKLGEVDRQLADLRRQAGEGQQPREAQQAGENSQRGGQPDAQQQGERSASPQGQQGATGQEGPGDGGRGGEVQRADEQGRPWSDARELVDELRREDGLGRSTPELQRFNPGISAPGTEAWKQDFAKWEELKQQVEIALEQAETSLAAQLRAQESKDRLNAGATQAVPDAYRRLVDKYYRALAAKKKP